MKVSEIMRSYCVKVNGGSGVLVNAMTQEYSYVLTAAHVIPEKQGELVVHDYQDNSLDVLAVLTLPEWNDSKPELYDFAILKVDYQERIAQESLPASGLNDRALLTLVGFPVTERNSSNPIKEYPGYKNSVYNDLIIVCLDGIPGTATIKGMSGGGVYHIQDEKPFLIGVEFQMDSTGQDQQYGRVQCYSLARFEEIITAHSSASMIPAYLECFSNMRDKVFSFNVYDQNNVSALKQGLDVAVGHLIENQLLPPYKVMKQYHSDLLVDPKNIGDLKTYELWIAYLEFLVISVLIDLPEGVDDAYLKSLDRKRRLIYTSNGTNWISNLENLLKIAHRLLDKDGVLIVASPESAASVLPPDLRLESIITNISVVPNKGPFTAIDSVENELLKSFKLTHLEGLRNRCVIDVEDEYLNLQMCESTNLLRKKLSEIIN
jgi:hypothetical protein